MSVTKRRPAPSRPRTLRAVTISRSQVAKRSRRLLIVAMVLFASVVSTRGWGVMARPSFVYALAATAVWCWWRAPIRATLSDGAVELVAKSTTSVVAVDDITSICQFTGPMGRRWWIVAGPFRHLSLFDTPDVRAFLVAVIEELPPTARCDTRLLDVAHLRPKRGK
jgi:muconolactone delta-isomerase